MRKAFRLKPVIVVVLLLLIGSCGPPQKDLKTKFLSMGIDNLGYVVSFYDRSGEHEYLPAGHGAPLLSIRINDSIYAPESANFNSTNNMLRLSYDQGNCHANIKITTQKTHLTFELTQMEHANMQTCEHVNMVIWGPYPTTISKSIGETVGVVRGETFAMGLQALNPKTLGGYPWKENDCMPQMDIFDGDDPHDLYEEGKRYVLYRVEAAKPDTFGSTLQAYCRNRNSERITENWGHERYTIPPYDDGGIIGSRIAIFGCPVDQCLDMIGEIELAEGLPHPLIHGTWGKESAQATAAYMILAFGEEDVEKAISYTKKAGLHYLYHPGPFDTWGHFRFNHQFPNGVDGLRACVKTAEKDSIYIGIHTLSNFITTNDAYVTPVPDERLARVGSASLAGKIGAGQAIIPIDDPFIFRQMKNNNLKTVMVDEELISYSSVSEGPPYFLLDCTRGAYGTLASAHEQGAFVSLLADHAYNVFLTDADLTKEVAINLANLFNDCGLRQISFDGLEGNRSTGMGNYGEILMTSTWYNHLKQDIKNHFIADASRTSHYFWHIFTRMNWGEPWYAGFRESQTEYRFKNQDYFRRNLMPGMLGWFLLTRETSLEDIEWMLAKSAAYDAGYGFVCNYKSLEENGLTDAILSQIKLWEKARMGRVFSAEIKKTLRDPETEFHLQHIEGKKPELQQYYVERYHYSTRERQPGERDWSSYTFTNPYEAQPLQFLITVPESQVFKSPVLEINNTHSIEIPVDREKGYIIKYDGKDQIVIFNNAWKKIHAQSVDNTLLQVDNGKQTLKFRGEVVGKNPQPVKIEFKTMQRLSYF